jgi:FkbM family methyltransferase
LQNSIGVIHIGANSGQERDIYQMHKLAVLWVEADPDTYITLEENIKTYPNQTAVQSLLLDRDGIDSPFYISTNHAASSSIYPMAQHKKFWPRVEYANEITLKSESLATLVNRITIDLTLYDTMVLDTQGSELRVLQGGADILWGIHTLLIETSDCELYLGACYDSEIAEFLKPFGFVEIERRVTKSIPEIGACYDVLYQKPLFTNPNQTSKNTVEARPLSKDNFRSLRKTLKKFGLPPLQFQTDKNEIEFIINLLKPYNSEFDLIRFGPERDGGYLVPDDLDEITACFSPGIGNSSGFELDCYRKGMKIFLADKSISPQSSLPFEFNYLPKFLGKETKDDFISLTDWLTESKIDITKDLLLQMDIEAFEYETLTAVSQTTLNMFRIIVIELHFLDLLIYKPWFEKIAPIIKLLTTNHTVVHLHPNNCCGVFKTGSHEIPRTLEVTLLRNDRIKEKSPATLFPHPLDRENTDKPPFNLPENWYLDKNLSPKIKAIVLTYDRNSIITEHMIKCYDELWPGHPFIFRIPYQDKNRCNTGLNREYVKTSPAIKETVLTLLDNLEDEDWIYWCMDDKYPIKLNVPEIELICKSLLNADISNLSGVLFCRARKMLDQNYLMGEQILSKTEKLIERKAYHQIWIPQFLKVKVIRHLFLSFPNITRARTMDPLKHTIIKPNDHRLFVTQTNHAVFGESSFDGILTANCYQSMVDKCMAVPSSFEINFKKTTIIGTL